MDIITKESTVPSVHDLITHKWENEVKGCKK